MWVGRGKNQTLKRNTWKIRSRKGNIHEPFKEWSSASARSAFGRYAESGRHVRTSFAFLSLPESLIMSAEESTSVPAPSLLFHFRLCLREQSLKRNTFGCAGRSCVTSGVFPACSGPLSFARWTV